MFENEALEFDSETGEVIESHPQLAAGIAAYDMAQANPVSSKPRGKRVKRTEAQMVADLGGSALKEAIYVLDRIAKLEEKIPELLSYISEKGRDRVFEERPELKRYL